MSERCLRGHSDHYCKHRVVHQGDTALLPSVGSVRVSDSVTAHSTRHMHYKMTCHSGECVVQIGVRRCHSSVYMLWTVKHPSGDI